MVEVRVDIVNTDGIHTLCLSASFLEYPSLYAPNRCIRAASRKQTFPSLKGSRPEDGS